jgi:hypothetical protein
MDKKARMRKMNSTNAVNEQQILQSCGMAYTLSARRRTVEARDTVGAGQQRYIAVWTAAQNRGGCV